MDIKPIETEYNGYRFRSRLEARYAVFFDYLGADYDYEPEGFDLGKLGYYLPDFYLKDLKLYLEVKPDRTDVDMTRVRRQMEAFRDYHPIVLCVGDAGPRWTDTIYCFDLTDSSGGSYQNSCGWDWCETCKGLTITITDDDTRLLHGGRELYSSGLFNDLLRISNCNTDHRHKTVIGPIFDAWDFAKKARFEHGEKPDPRTFQHAILHRR